MLRIKMILKKYIIFSSMAIILFANSAFIEVNGFVNSSNNLIDDHSRNLMDSNIYFGDGVWTTTGPYGVRITGLAIDPSNNQIMYASSPDGNTQVFKSIDGGETWFASDNGMIDGGGEIFNFAFDFQAPGVVYVAYQAGVYKSEDYGENWVKKSTFDNNNEPYIIRPWSIDSSIVDGTLFVGAYGAFVGLKGGIFRSKDGGDSWEQVATSEETDGIIKSIVVSPSAPHIIYAGGYNGGVFKSIDWGDSWFRIDGSFGVPPSVLSMEVDPYDAQVVYMSTNSGVYKTSNGGQTWSPIGSGLDTSYINEIVIDPGNQQIIYVGGSEGAPGVYRSLDNTGLTWAPMNDGMGSRSVYSLTINNANDQNIFAGTSSGIWKYSVSNEIKDFSISINNGELFTNRIEVVLSLSAPSGTTEIMMSNDGGFSGAIWEPFTQQKSWTITSYGDVIIPRVVYVKFKANNQISGVYQDDIVLDITPPTGGVEITQLGSDSKESGSFEIFITSQIKPKTETFSVYLPLILKDYRFGYTLVDLNLHASDEMSGVSEMMISNDISFSESTWESYTVNKEWWLLNSGLKMVYVKYRDHAGNVSQIYTDQVSP